MQHHKEVIAMTMQQIVRQFQDEVMEAHLGKLRAENEEYQEIERELLRLAHKVRNIWKRLVTVSKKSLWITVIPGIVRNLPIITVCILPG